MASTTTFRSSSSTPSAEAPLAVPEHDAEEVGVEKDLHATGDPLEYLFETLEW